MKAYLEPTQDAGRAFFMRGITGSVVMLNLLRYRATAYRLYMEHTMPQLEKSGGKLLFFGRGGRLLIGPSEERWDAAMLVQQSSPAAFMAFASNAQYLAGIGHRTAALEDSRLLPLEESGW